MTEPPAETRSAPTDAAGDEGPLDPRLVLGEVAAALRWARFGGALAVPRDPNAPTPEPVLGSPPARKPAPRPAPKSAPKPALPAIAAHSVGPRDARVALIVAGVEGDTAGACWRGPDGALLAKMIGAMGLNTADVYAVTLVEQDNADTEPLSSQLRAVQPEAMLVFGEQAARWLLRTEARIDDLRGRWRKPAGVPTMVTYGPKTLLEMPLYKRSAWADLQEVMARLGLGKQPVRGR